MKKKHSIDDIIKEIKRELKYREWVYPGLIERGKMTINRARIQNERLQAAIEILEIKKSEQHGQQEELF